MCEVVDCWKWRVLRIEVLKNGRRETVIDYCWASGGLKGRHHRKGHRGCVIKQWGRAGGAASASRHEKWWAGSARVVYSRRASYLCLSC